jgi:hypothetical protein
MHPEETSRYESPPFPRPVTGFVGREAELARARSLLARETLFLVYGVAGIGKSEFVYKVVEEARALPSLRGAATLCLSARAERRCEHLVSILRLRLGADPEPHAGLADDLDAVARILEARPTLVFIDDVHHLDPETVAEVLGYLARHVSRSRIFVASRLEVLLPAGTPPPVICRLQPLNREATATLMENVCHTLGLSSPDAEGIFTRSGGSPFYVLRELSDLRYAPRSGEDPLAAALRDLAPPLRHTLLLARLLRRRLRPSDLQGDQALWELARRFLIDIDRGVIIVHDLIGEALAREVSEEELHAARRDATRPGCSCAAPRPRRTRSPPIPRSTSWRRCCTSWPRASTPTRGRRSSAGTACSPASRSTTSRSTSCPRCARRCPSSSSRSRCARRASW